MSVCSVTLFKRVEVMWTDALVVQSHACNPICKHLNLKPTSNRAKVQNALA